MNTLALLCALASIACSPRARASTPPTTEITLATYNVENLFDSYDDPYTEDETTPASTQEKLRALGRAVDKLDADVLALQEVESRRLLERFNLTHVAHPYPYVVLIEGNDSRGIDVAVLSRLPVLASTSHRHRTQPASGTGRHVWFSRDLLKVDLQATDAETLSVYVTHFRAGVDDAQREAIRFQEAELARAIIDEETRHSPDGLFALTGDLNDRPGSRAVKALLARGGLFDLPWKDEAATRCGKEGCVRLDYILVSPALKGRLVPGSNAVAAGAPFEQASDHRPVMARFKLRGSPVADRSPESIPPGRTEWEPKASGEGLPGARPSPVAAAVAAATPAPDRTSPAPESAYRSICPDAPEARDAMAATDLDKLERLIGQDVAVRGNVYRCAPSPSGRIYFVDLAKDFRHAVSVVLMKNDVAAFPGIGSLVGREVVVRGRLSTHKGRPQIVLKDPSQVMIIAACGR